MKKKKVAKKKAAVIRSVADGAEIINRKVEDVWMTSEGFDIMGFTAQEARELSTDEVYNAASWLKYSFGPCLRGESDGDWLESAKTLQTILTKDNR